MTTQELKDKIKNIVGAVYSSIKPIKIDEPPVISLDNYRFPILKKFPQIEDTLIQLLSKQYDLFLKDIQWVAPKPTTFRIILANDKDFYLIYTDRTWITKVEGKKYYMLNVNEADRASEAIARILSYGDKENIEVKKEAPQQPPAEEAPAEEAPAEEAPAEETPAEEA